MTIAIIGTGNIGGTLGRLWATRGHRIVFASRDPEAPRIQSLLSRIGAAASAAPLPEALAEADVVLLAVPYHVIPETLAAAGSLAGKVLIDPSNPLGPEGLTVGYSDSAGEQVARLAPGARVIKAFNTVGWGQLEHPRVGGQIASMPIAGDDASAKAVVAELIAELGFEVVDAGPLQAARLLEPLAMLWIRLSIARGPGRRIGFKLLQD